MVDELLYAHSVQRFEAMLRNISSLERMVAQFESKPPVTVRLPRRWQFVFFPRFARRLTSSGARCNDPR